MNCCDRDEIIKQCEELIEETERLRDLLREGYERVKREQLWEFEDGGWRKRTLEALEGKAVKR